MSKVLTGVMFMLLLTAPAAARPTKLVDASRPTISETMQGPQMFDCNAGGPAGIVVALAAIGLAGRRRR